MLPPRFIPKIIKSKKTQKSQTLKNPKTQTKPNLFQRYYKKESLVYYILISSHLPTSTTLNSLSPFNLHPSLLQGSTGCSLLLANCDPISNVVVQRLLWPLFTITTQAEAVAVVDPDPDLPRKPPPQTHQPLHHIITQQPKSAKSHEPSQNQIHSSPWLDPPSPQQPTAAACP